MGVAGTTCDGERVFGSSSWGPAMVEPARRAGCGTCVLAVLAMLLVTTADCATYLTNDYTTLLYDPNVSSNVITTLPPNTAVSIICKVQATDAANTVNGDPWWLQVNVPSSPWTGYYVSDYYVECGGYCPGTPC